MGLVIMKTEGGQVEGAELALAQCTAFLEEATGQAIDDLCATFRENARVSRHADNDAVAELLVEAWGVHGHLLDEPGDYMLAFV